MSQPVREYPNRFLQDYSPDRLYPSYYSEVELSPTPAASHANRVLPRPYRTPAQRQLPNTSRFTPKSFNAALKRLASKANETIQKTFRKDFSFNKFSSSVTSMKDTFKALDHNELHKRALSDRPALPRVPIRSALPRVNTVAASAGPKEQHQRRPTGPREMPKQLAKYDGYFEFKTRFETRFRASDKNSQFNYH